MSFDDASQSAVTTRDDIERELDALPEPALQEVLALIRARKRRGVTITALLSEAALAEDWLSPEEDEAWADL